MKRSWSQRLVPILPYLVIYWFFSKLGEAYRLTPSKDMIQKLLATMPNLGKSMANPMPSSNPFDMLFGVCGALAILVFVWVKRKSAKNWRKDIEYGSAKWGSRQDIEPFVDPDPQNNIILTASESLTLNGRPKEPKNARNKNVLIIGGSGSGKTRFWLKPNLMQLHSSYVVTDPKGQLIV